jgi:hypothetical protein
MNNIKVFISVVIATSAIFFSQQTYASDDEVFYIGGGIGQSEASGYCSGVSSPFTCKSTNTLSRAIVGFQSNRWFGIELNYIDLGKFSMNGSGTAGGMVCNPVCSFPTGTYAYTEIIKSKGFQFASVGSVPLGKGLFLLGKLGMMHWTVSGSTLLSVAGFPAGTVNFYPTNGAIGLHGFVSNNASDSGNSPVLGFGLKYEIGEQFAVRGEFEVAPKIGSAATGKYDYKIYSTSLIYKF